MNNGGGTFRPGPNTRNGGRGGGPARGGRGGARGRGGQRGGGGGGGHMNNGGGGGGGGFTGFDNGGGGGGNAPIFVRGGSARGRGRGGRGGQRGGGQQQGGGQQGGYQQNNYHEGGGGGGGGNAVLDISNIPNNMEYGAFQTWLNQNGPEGLRWSSLKLSRGTAQMTIHANQAANLMQVLNGREIAPGVHLIVELGATAGRPLSQQEKHNLAAAVRASYNPQQKMIDLSTLAGKYNLGFVNFQSNNFTSELFNSLGAVAGDAITINLASNQIQSLSCFQGMIRALPELKNISLSNNLIGNVDQFEHLSGYRDKLNEIIATGNPFFIAFTTAPGAPAQNAQQLDYSVYQQYISSIFPSLKLLDTRPIQSLIDFDLPTTLQTAATSSLPPLKESYFDSRTHETMCYAFVKRYFHLYDTDRQHPDLFSVYGDNAMFSLTYQPEPKFGNTKYSDQNRNILALGTAKARAASELALLRRSRVAILTALEGLPRSQHDTGSFVADVVKVPSSNSQLNLLTITIRGQYLEVEKGNLLRCFHRTFLCTGPSNEARAKEWPVSILHDTLYIGAGKLNVSATSSSTIDPRLLSPQPSSAPTMAPLTPNDQQMVLQLSQTTGVTHATAINALMQARGDMNQALALIQGLR